MAPAHIALITLFEIIFASRISFSFGLLQTIKNDDFLLCFEYLDYKKGKGHSQAVVPAFIVLYFEISFEFMPKPWLGSLLTLESMSLEAFALRTQCTTFTDPDPLGLPILLASPAAWPIR